MPPNNSLEHLRAIGEVVSFFAEALRPQDISELAISAHCALVPLYKPSPVSRSDFASSGLISEHQGHTPFCVGPLQKRQIYPGPACISYRYESMPAVVNSDTSECGSSIKKCAPQIGSGKIRFIQIRIFQVRSKEIGLLHECSPEAGSL